MRKRLHYAMPRVPLYKHKQEVKEEETRDHENGAEAVPGRAAISHVGIMAKRIGEKERKKRKTYKPPEEQPLWGDVESSESEETGDEEDGSEEIHLIGQS